MIFLPMTASLPAASPSRESWRRSMRQARCVATKFLAAALFAGVALLPFASEAQEPQDQPPQASGASQQIPIDSGKAAEALFSAVNAYRGGNKVRDLVWNNALWQTAQHYAEVLAASKSAGHGADGKIPQQRAEEKGYPCPVAENAYSSDPAGRIDDEDAAALKALDTWKNSPPDNDNLVSPLWTETGIGAAAWSHEGQTYTVFVQLFGHPCCGAKPEPVPLLEQTPAPSLERYVETAPVPIPACPDWDPDCRGCPAWNPYCHRCPPWDPDCRRCPSWNPYCNRCPPWDPACRSCPPWNLHCHGCPPWNPGCRQCPPTNPDCRRHICPNGGVWPRCNPIGHVCPNGGVWPHCNPVAHVCPNGGVWPRCNPVGHVCPNGGVWPRCNKIPVHVCPNGGLWPNCNKPAAVIKHGDYSWRQPPAKKIIVHPEKQIRRQQNFQKRLDTIRHNQRQNFNKPRHN